MKRKCTKNVRRHSASLFTNPLSFSQTNNPRFLYPLSHLGAHGVFANTWVRFLQSSPNMCGTLAMSRLHSTLKVTRNVETYVLTSIYSDWQLNKSMKLLLEKQTGICVKPRSYLQIPIYGKRLVPVNWRTPKWAGGCQKRKCIKPKTCQPQESAARSGRRSKLVENRPFKQTKN